MISSLSTDWQQEAMTPQQQWGAKHIFSGQQIKLSLSSRTDAKVKCNDLRDPKLLMCGGPNVT
jgi:hypothetical protein